MEGVILADQIKSLDWRARKAEFLATIPNDTMDDVVAKLRVLIEVDV